jgi:UDP-glucose 4-epimerase
MAILIINGVGYIGSHTCVGLLNAGYEVIVVDNLSNSKPKSLNHIKRVNGRDFKFYKVNLLDKAALEGKFIDSSIERVIHFARLKAVSESVQVPLQYYHNDIIGTLILCELMKKYNVKRLVFSSSVTVYGILECVPISENFPLKATNPYGRTKLMTEEILRNLYIPDNDWNIALLRYFNSIGAHQSGRIGEDPNGVPNNLMPYITQVDVEELEKL